MKDSRYTAVAVLLHWAIALAILTNIGIGLWMHEAIDAPQTQARAAAAYQVHKSIGLSVLVLSVLRLGWRLRHPPPPLPVAMPVWERAAAHITHWAFYALMMGLPLSGWLLVSTQWRDGAPLQVPTLWFGLLEVPHLFGLHEAAPQVRDRLSETALEVHEIMALGTLALLALHVAAALKHQFLDRDDVLARMVPALELAMERRRKWCLRAGFLAIVIAAVAIAAALLTEPGRVGNAGAGSGAITSAPGSWRILPEPSFIRFSGKHAGKPFQGRFTRWQADIRIDRANVPDSVITATVETGSATDGVALHDDTLPQREWFDVENHPAARYQATDIEKRPEGSYLLKGILTIKERDVPVPALELTLEDGSAVISGSFVMDRGDADLGMESDPRGKWVSREITVRVNAVAEPR